MPQVLKYNTSVITFSPTVTAGLYAAGNTVGGKQTLTNFFHAKGQMKMLVGGILIDSAAQAAAYKLHFFKNDYSAPADKAAFTISDADSLFHLGFVQFSSSNNVTLVNNSINTLTLANSNLPMTVISNDLNLYVQLQTDGTPTYVSTADIKVVMYFEE
jgi:hypothetical protein